MVAGVPSYPILNVAALRFIYPTEFKTMLRQISLSLVCLVVPMTFTAAGCTGSAEGQITATPDELAEFQIQQQRDIQAAQERAKTEKP
ncbi:hypothetical protein Rcae01_04088 [Novipirellula caenicola]|uniref:Uncharacterized protein n=1 Tax=Novipirellula caenicola TaxID=1536901 RepID=A0ABP9VTZ6_9BACT